MPPLRVPPLDHTSCEFELYCRNIQDTERAMESVRTPVNPTITASGQSPYVTMTMALSAAANVLNRAIWRIRRIIDGLIISAGP